jgi:PAS domain S-box-containing protein
MTNGDTNKNITLEYHLQIVELITDISNKLVQTETRGDLDQVIDESLEKIGKFSNVDVSYLFQFSEDRKTLSETHDWTREGLQSNKPHLQNLPAEQFPWVLSQLRQGKVIQIKDPSEIPEEGQSLMALSKKINLTSLVMVPMLFKDTLIGHLGFSKRNEAKVWSEHDVSLLRLLAEIYTNAIIRHRHEEALRQKNRALQAVSNVNTALVKADDIDAFLASICKILVETGGYKMSWIGKKIDDKEKTVEPLSHCGLDDGYLKNTTITWSNKHKSGRGPTGEAIRTGKSAVNKNTSENPDFEPWLEEAKKRGYNSSAAIPIKVDGKVWGVINIYSEEIDAFDKDEVALLQELAGDAGVGINSLKNKQELESTLDQLQRFRTAIDEANDSIVIYRAKDGRIVDANKAASQQLEYTRDELLQKTILDIALKHKGVEYDNWQELLEITKKRLESGENTFEGLAQRKDGSTFPFESNVRYLEVGDKGYVVTINRDITERKKQREKRQELEQLKNRFINALTHTTRTPLTNMRLGLEMLQSEDLGKLNEQQHKIIQKTLAKEEEVLRLITNMNLALDIEQQQLTLEKTPSSLRSLTLSVKSQFEKYFTTKSISLEITGEQSLPSAEIDKEKMRRAVEILMENAYHYTPENGNVEIHFEQNNGSIRLSVIDDGIGIPEAEQSHIFERFFRASNASTHYPDGVGLGLYIAKSITEKHNGSVGFNSKKGKGSTFWIEIPTS